MDDEDILRGRASALVHTAGLAAVLTILRRIEHQLRPDHPALPDVAALFVQTRKRLLQQSLEQLETIAPGEAARMQELLDQACTHFPLDYE